MSIGKERAAEEEVNILVLSITVNTLPGQKNKGHHLDLTKPTGKSLLLDNYCSD